MRPFLASSSGRPGAGRSPRLQVAGLPSERVVAVRVPGLGEPLNPGDGEEDLDLGCERSVKIK